MPRVALCMIVKDAAATLDACLESVRGVVNEVVIADTGSTDSTMALARERGARVVEIPWENDFAAARNRALAAVQAEWVLVLDADEILDAGAAKAIPQLTARDIAGYQVTIRHYVHTLEDRLWDQPAKPNDSSLAAAKAFPAYVEHENVRLFRRDSRIYFVGRVHETVGSRIEECGLRLGRAPFLIHHFGLADNPETRARKNRLYHDLGKRKVADMPLDAQAHLELGLVELDNMGNVEEALKCFQKACQINPRLGVSWFFEGVAQMRLGKFADALASFDAAERKGRATTATAEMIGDAHYNLGEFPDAARCYEKALKLARESARIESKLGLAAVRAGKTEEGLRRILRSLAQEPALGELHDRLILALVWLDRIDEAAHAAEAKLRMVKGAPASDFVRAASLWSKTGNWSRAVAVVHVGLKLYQDDAVLKRTLEELSAHAGPKVGELLEALSSSK